METAGRSALRSRLQLVAAAALFSTGGACIKLCALAPLQVAGFRSLIAATVLLLAWPAARRGLTLRSFLFGLLYAGTMICFVTANKLTTAASAIYLQSTAPLFVLLASPFVLHEKVRRADLLFMAGLAVGIVLCFAPSTPQPAAAGSDGGAATNGEVIGRLVALLSGLFWALVIVGLRWFGRRSATAQGAEDGAASAVVAGNLSTFVAAGVLSLALRQPFAPDFAAFAPGELRSTLLALGFLGCFQVALAYVSLSRGMRGVPAVEASLLLLVEPVFSPFWAFLVHHEAPGRFTLLGGGVILVATAFHAIATARKGLP